VTPRRVAGRVVTAAFLGSALSACGGTAPRPSSTIDATGPAIAVVQRAEFPPLGTPVSPRRAAWGGGVERAGLVRAVAEALASRPADASADCLAEEIAVRFAADGVVPGPVWIQHLAEHCGSPASPVDAFAVTAPSEAELVAGLGRLPAEVVAGVGGIGITRHRDGRVTLALVPGPPPFVLTSPQGLPRTAAAGGALEIAARVTPGVPHRVFIDSRAPGASVRTFDAVVEPDGAMRFSVEVPPGSNATTAIEVARVEGRFLRSIAELVVHTGAASTPPAPPAVPAPPRERSDVESTLRERLTTSRGAAGASGLGAGGGNAVLDAWFDLAVLGRAKGDPALPRSPTGDPFVQATWVFSTGSGPEDALSRLLATPLGRGALLAGAVDAPTHVSFALRPYDGRPGVDLMVVLLKAFAPVALDALRPALLDALARVPRPTPSKPLEPSAPLDAVAQALGADILAGKVRWDALPGETGRRLGVAEVGATRFAAGAVVLENLSLLDLTAEAPLADPAFHRIGLGLVSGRAPSETVPRHVLVYVVTDRAD
jgi:hypothetical protein